MPAWTVRFFLVVFFILATPLGVGARTTIPAPPHPTFIAHAGGEIRGLRYTNSLEALHESYAKGFRFFEIDFEVTKDGHIVLLHDWAKSIERLYNAKPQVYTRDAFKQLRLQSDLTSLTWDELVGWLSEHPDATIITDIKWKPVSVLRAMVRTNPEARTRLIPQIYNFYQYRRVRALGFDHMILTLYATPYTDSAVVRFVKKHSVWAVTMPTKRAVRGTLVAKLKGFSVPVYTHPVDTVDVLSAVREMGVHGVYTASLGPQ